ncbi:DUF6786 family protein [Wocania arenilitoris]
MSCQGNIAKNITNQESKEEVILSKGTFGYDKQFLTQHYKNTIVLENKAEQSAILVSPELQGRVMTSTLGGDNGKSFGWINHDLIASKKINPQFNAFGGEERLWLGPEGGQFSLYFQKGTTFDFENWKVPNMIDTEPFELLSKTKETAIFKKQKTLENYSGTTFTLEIRRTIKLLDKEAIKTRLKLKDTSISVVAYNETVKAHCATS